MTNFPKRRRRHKRVLAISPAQRGVGYSIFLAPYVPFDWGVKRLRNSKNPEALGKIRALLEWYRPDVLVLENCAGEGSRRGRRVQRLLRSAVRLADTHRIVVKGYSRGMIRHCFAATGARTKQEIAAVIAGQLKELAGRLPSKRKPWQNEPLAMSIFDAAALAWSYFHFAKGHRFVE